MRTNCCMRSFFLLSTAFVFAASPLPFAASQAAAGTSTSLPGEPGQGSKLSYKLGPEDTLTVVVKDEPTILPGPYAVDLSGKITLPELGTVHAEGMTVEQLTAELTQRAKAFLQNPVISVSVTDYKSQRVSVLGAVANPGVQQIKGRKTLFEAVSEAGGLKSSAGGHITLTRKKQYGIIPLPGAKSDMSDSFSIADVSVDDLMNGRNPVRNVELRPDDTVTVAKSLSVYVIGAVNRAGGYELAEKDSMSVLQALALAQGTNRTAAMKSAKILRAADDGGARKEVMFDLNKVMQGHEPDITLRGDDILFIPNSTAKSASYRALDALIATGSGVAMYHAY